MARHVTIDQARLTEFCKTHGIRRLSLFGSVLRDDFRPDSDVDVLVEFEQGREPGLLAMAHMERNLTELLGRAVDMRTPEDLSRFFRDQVIAHAQVQYAA